MGIRDLIALVEKQPGLYRRESWNDLPGKKKRFAIDGLVWNECPPELRDYDDDYWTWVKSAFGLTKGDMTRLIDLNYRRASSNRKAKELVLRYLRRVAEKRGEGNE